MAEADGGNAFQSEIQTTLARVNLEAVDGSLFPDFRPMDLKSRKFELHEFNGIGEVRACNGSGSLANPHPNQGTKLTINLKSVIGSEVYYELQILMCYPFGLKVETITVSLFIQTTKGLVLLKEGIQLRTVSGPKPKGVTVGCTAQATTPKHSHYYYKVFPLCSIEKIVDHVWLSKSLGTTVSGAATTGDTMGVVVHTGAYANLVVTGALPFIPIQNRIKSTKAFLCSMKTLLRDGVMSDLKLNGIPCHRVILSCQSDVFQQMLSANMMESNSGEIRITESEESVHALLKYMYYRETSELATQSPEVVTELIGLGHRFNIPSLVEVAVNSLLERPTGETGMDLDLILELFAFSEKTDLVALEMTLICILKRRQVKNPETIQGLFALHPEAAARILSKAFGPDFQLFPH